MDDYEKIQKTLFFTKQQLLVSKRYADRKDLLEALLKENVQYSLEDVDSRIKEFLRGRC